MSQHREQSQVRVRVRVRGFGLGWRPEISQNRETQVIPPPAKFIVLTITERAHYKAESETACRVNVLKLVSPNQPDLQQLWGQLASKSNALSLREHAPLVGYSCGPRHRSS